MGRAGQQRPRDRRCDLRDEINSARRAEASVKVNVGEVKSEEQHSIATNSPFTFPVQRTEFPAKFKMPSISTYDGASEPFRHLNNYNTLMRSVKADIDGVKCLMFPTTLSGSAYTWFTSLKPRSIGSFAELSTQFTTHFQTFQRARPSTATLFACRQRPDESLREYTYRFDSLATQIPGLEPPVAVAALIQGSTNLHFCGSLGKRPPTDFCDLKSRMQKYILYEDVVNAKRGRLNANPPEKRRSEDLPPPQPSKRFRPQERPGLRQHGGFTPLSRSPAEILLAIEGKQILRYPSQPSDPSKTRRATGKYCRFHRATGHDTNDCYQLKHEIERLIQRGQLREYQQEERPDRTEEPQRRRTEQTETEQTQAVLPVINTISGGRAGGGDSNQDRRSHVRAVYSTTLGQKRAEPSRPSEAILFSDADVRADVQYPHDDPIVVSVPIAGHLVRRALVDTGSSVNILFGQAFDQLRLPAADVRPLNTPLVGFSGHQVAPRGTIVLPVVLGSSPSVQLSTEFTIVDVPSAYNVIIGRPLLGAARAIPSQHHLKVKFPTGKGVGEMLGDQKTARTCYVATLRQSLQVTVEQKQEA